MMQILRSIWAMCIQKLGKIKEAQEMYNRALKLDPQNGLLQKKLEELIRNK